MGCLLTALHTTSQNSSVRPVIRLIMLGNLQTLPSFDDQEFHYMCFHPEFHLFLISRHGLVWTSIRLATTRLGPQDQSYGASLYEVEVCPSKLQYFLLNKFCTNKKHRSQSYHLLEKGSHSHKVHVHEQVQYSLHAPLSKNSTCSRSAASFKNM